MRFLLLFWPTNDPFRLKHFAGTNIIGNAVVLWALYALYFVTYKLVNINKEMYCTSEGDVFNKITYLRLLTIIYRINIDIYITRT